MYAVDENDPYRRYICKSNKDAESANWLRFGLACDHNISRVFSIFENFYDIEEVVNQASYHTEPSISASEI